MKILEMKHINKAFPGVKALDDVNFSVNKGEVHGLLGANGAGKSTLMKVLSGVYMQDSGEIFLKGESVSIESPLDAHERGIAIIHQELSLVPTLSVAENILIGRLKGKSFNVNWKKMNEEASFYLKQIGTKIKPTTKVRDLSVAEMQLVEIAKALSYNAELIVMDEPSAVLSGNELEQLFNTIATLTNDGVTIVYISHRLEEISNICDRLTIMRDGMVIETREVKDTSREDIIRGIVGGDLKDEYPSREGIEIGEQLLEVKNLQVKDQLKDISFDVKAGEIVGLAGLVGAGRTEIARCIFGVDTFDEGDIYLKGSKVKINSPRKAIQQGIALVPEDRKKQGLVTIFSLSRNFTMTALHKVNMFGFLKSKKEVKESHHFVDKLKIKTPSIQQLALNLSGGNQQKVVVAKYLFSDADILILDEPTRGVDVGAKREIYLVINELAKEGKAVLLISSDWEELIALSDRLVVVHEGEIKGELDGAEATEEKILDRALS